MDDPKPPSRRREMTALGLAVWCAWHEGLNFCLYLGASRGGKRRRAFFVRDGYHVPPKGAEIVATVSPTGLFRLMGPWATTTSALAVHARTEEASHELTRPGPV